MSDRKTKRPAWFETFFDGLYGKVLGNQFDPEVSRAQARLIKRLLHLRRGQHVLDVPCGQGRISIPLAGMGFDVTGVDLTSGFVRRARRQARAEGVAARFVQTDMRQIEYDSQFDAAVNWFSSFGYFSDAENLDVARRLYRSLRPGGRLLIDGMNKSFILAHWRSGGDDMIGGVRVVTRNRWDSATGRVCGTWTFTGAGRPRRHRIAMRVYNGTEIRQLLRTAGFRDIELFGLRSLHSGCREERFTRHSARMIAVARRPKV